MVVCPGLVLGGHLGSGFSDLCVCPDVPEPVLGRAGAGLGQHHGAVGVFAGACVCVCVFGANGEQIWQLLLLAVTEQGLSVDASQQRRDLFPSIPRHM